jgi:hypothetical protein
VGVDAAGHDEVWLRDQNSGVWRYDPSTSIFVISTGGYLSTIAAGRGEVFGLDTPTGPQGGHLFWKYNDQTGWASPWQMGQTNYFQSLTVGIDLNGKDEVWVEDLADRIWQYRADGSWWDDWLPGYSRGVLQMSAGNGELFFLGRDNQLYVFADFPMTDLFGRWHPASTWIATGVYGQSFSVGVDYQNTIDAIQTKDAVWVLDAYDDVTELTFYFSSLYVPPNGRSHL